jgi:hypothetical protein
MLDATQDPQELAAMIHMRWDALKVDNRLTAERR